MKRTFSGPIQMIWKQRHERQVTVSVAGNKGVGGAVVGLLDVQGGGDSRSSRTSL